MSSLPPFPPATAISNFLVLCSPRRLEEALADLNSVDEGLSTTGLRTGTAVMMAFVVFVSHLFYVFVLNLDISALLPKDLLPRYTAKSELGYALIQSVSMCLFIVCCAYRIYVLFFFITFFSHSLH